MKKELRQTELPYEENERVSKDRKALRRKYSKQAECLVIPAPPSGSKTKSATCKQVLMFIETKVGAYEGCRLLFSTIMDKTGIRQRATLAHALAYLKLLGLIDWTRTGRSNVYQINRANVRKMLGEQTADAGTSNIGTDNDRTSEVGTSNIGTSNDRTSEVGSSTQPLTMSLNSIPTSSSIDDQQTTASRREWEEVESRLVKHLSHWQPPLAALKERVDASHAKAILDLFELSAGIYGDRGPGILYRRLMNCHPDSALCDHWPPPTLSAQVTRCRQLYSNAIRYVMNESGQLPTGPILASWFVKEAAEKGFSETEAKQAMFAARNDVAGIVASWRLEQQSVEDEARSK